MQKKGQSLSIEMKADGHEALAQAMPSFCEPLFPSRTVISNSTANKKTEAHWLELSSRHHDRVMSTIACSLDAATPALTAIDPRGLVVRNVAYCRKIAGGTAHRRVTQHRYNAAAQLIANLDPRLSRQMRTEPGTKANLTTTYSLNGATLMTDSVDAGWRLVVAKEASYACLSWNARGSHTNTRYDALLRPVSISEQGTRSEPKTVERFTYGDGSAESAKRNVCGRIYRHDDTAGDRQITGYTLRGEPLSEVRRFLKHLQIPSWPVELPLRDKLLNPENFTTTSHFAPTGELLFVVDAMGNLQRHQYDRAGLPRQTHLQLAGRPEQTIMSKIDYNAWGWPVSDTAGNGVVSTAQYRPEDGRLVRLLSQRAMDSALQDLRYDYDPVGNIVRTQEAALVTRHFKNQRTEAASTYGYDSSYQLMQATGRESCSPTNGPELPYYQSLPPDPTQLANYVQTYEYDDAGNLEKLLHVGARQYCRQMITASDSNRSLPLPDAGLDPDFANSFDASGNLKRLQPGPDLDWNLRDQLQEITLIPRPEDGSDRERYIYDGGGQRVRKVKNTRAKNVNHVAQVLYLPGLEIRTNTACNEILHVISVPIGRGSVRVLHWASVPPGLVANDQVRYGLSDQSGSNTVELDEEARVLNRESYYPFGGTAWFAARSETEGNYKTIRYSGKGRDSSGLYYYGFRYYVSWWLRWLSPDPAGSIDGLNRYAMTGNNPITFRDLLGLTKTPSELETSQLTDKGFKILARGLDELKTKFPDVYTHLSAALEYSEITVSAALEKLTNSDSAEQNRMSMEMIFGPQTNSEFIVPILIKKAKETAESLHSIRSGDGASKIVFISNSQRQSELNTEAFPIGELRTIYVTQNALEYNQINISSTVIHELTHLEGSYDYIYHGQAVIYSDDPMDDMKTETSVVKSIAIGNFDEKIANQSRKILNDETQLKVYGTAEKKGIATALQQPGVRTAVLLENADTIAFTLKHFAFPKLQERWQSQNGQ